MERMYLMGLPVDNSLRAEAVQLVADLAGGRIRSTISDRVCSRIFFLNAHCCNVAARNSAYREALHSADYIFADGIGVRLAGRFQGTPIADNVNGTDLFPMLMTALSGTGVRVFFVGARPPVIAALVRETARRWPGVTITGWTIGYFVRDSEVIEAVRLFGADLVFVAQGVPRQELWIDRFGDETGARVALAVGGLFDFYSGMMPRAPVWMRRIGMEWLFRLIQEPQRMWRRYIIGNAVFLVRAWSRRRRGVRP